MPNLIQISNNLQTGEKPTYSFFKLLLISIFSKGTTMNKKQTLSTKPIDPKNTELASDDVVKTNIPATSVADNATALAKMQEKILKAKQDSAKQSAAELQLMLAATSEQAKNIVSSEFPTPHGNYSMALCSSACWRALRDQLAHAHIHNEMVQQKKIVLQKRLDDDEFLSDIEKDSAIKQLAYYEVLEARLQETEYLLAEFKHLYDTACAAQYKEDLDRQQDIPADQRVFVTPPQLRWVKNSIKSANPNWEKDDDLERLEDRAFFVIDFAMNSTSR